MKFLMISSFLPSVLNFRGKLLEAIASHGYEIHIMAPDLKRFPEEVQKLRSLGYKVYRIPMHRTESNPIYDMKTLLIMYRMIRKIKPDAVLSYTIKPVIYGSLAAWMANVPKRFALITGLGYAFQNVESGKRSLFQKIVHGLYAQALKHVHKVFFQNPDDLKLFIDLKILDQQIPTVLVNGSGVDIQAFNTVPFPLDAQGHIRASFLMIARLLGDKGVREYAQAAKLIKAQYPDAEFHLVGWIDDNPSAIAQVELNEWVSDGRLRYWGKLSDVRPAIAESSVYVLPSYREGTPRTVLEAMAMGRAVITTDAPGCRETVIEEYNGYLVAVKSIDDLTKSMLHFIQDKLLILNMGAASRLIAQTKYDVNKVNESMIENMDIT